MLRTSPSGSRDGRSVASRARSRSADAKSSMGARVTRTTAIPIATEPNDVRCVLPRYDMIMSNDCRRGLGVFAGGKHGIIGVRSAISGTPNAPAKTGSSGASSSSSGAGSSSGRGGPARGRSQTRNPMSAIEHDTTLAAQQRKHGVTVTCMCLSTNEDESASLLWCGLTDGNVQIFRASRQPVGAPAFHAMPPRRQQELQKAALVQHATPSSLLFEARHHNGPVHSLAASDAAVFSGGADWRVLRWSLDEPFGVQGCIGTHSRAVRCLHVTSRVLASGGDDSVVRLWPFTALDRATALEGHTASVLCLASHRGSLWTAGEDATIRLWAVEGNRQCTKVLTSHRAHVVSLVPNDNLMFSFDKAGNMMVWDLRSKEVEPLHCYQCLGGHHPLASPSSAHGAGGSTFNSAAASRSASVASAAAPGGDNRSTTSGGSARGSSQQGMNTVAGAPIHDVKLVANVNGFIAWVFTSEGCKLSFLPFRSIEEELEVKYGEALDDDGIMSMSSMVSGGMDDVKRQLEEAQQREERQEALLEDLKDEFGEFADILGGDLKDLLDDSLEQYTASLFRMSRLYSQSVALVHANQVKEQANLHRKSGELLNQIDQLNTKLSEKQRQLSQANAKAAQQMSLKQDENTKLSIDLQRAHNENKQLQFEVKSAKEQVAALESVVTRHEAKLGKSAKSDVELAQTKAELKVTKEALHRLQSEAERQAENTAKSRAKLLGADAEKAALVEELEHQLQAARHGESTLQHQLREVTAELRSAKAKMEDAENDLSVARQRESVHNADKLARYSAGVGAEVGGAAAIRDADLGARMDQDAKALAARLDEATAELDRRSEQLKSLRDVNTSLAAQRDAAREEADETRQLVAGMQFNADDMGETDAFPTDGQSSSHVGGAAVVALLRTKTNTIEQLRAEVNLKAQQLAAAVETNAEEKARVDALQKAVEGMKSRVKAGGGAAAAGSRSSKRGKKDATSDDGGDSDAAGDNEAAAGGTRYKAEAKALRETVADRDRTIAQLRSDVADRDRRIAELQGELNEASRQLGEAQGRERARERHFESIAQQHVLEGDQQITLDGTTPGTKSGAAHAMSPLERLTFDLNTDRLPPQSASPDRYGSGGGISPQRAASMSPRRLERAGLAALSDAEAILSQHGMGLTDDASHVLGRRGHRDDSPVIEHVHEVSAIHRRVNNTNDDGAGDSGDDMLYMPVPRDGDLDRLVAYIDSVQRRLRELERAVASTTDDVARDKLLVEISQLHRQLTEAGRHNNPDGTTASVLDSAQRRILASQRTRAIAEEHWWRVPQRAEHGTVAWFEAGASAALATMRGFATSRSNSRATSPARTPSGSPPRATTVVFPKHTGDVKASPRRHGRSPTAAASPRRGPATSTSPSPRPHRSGRSPGKSARTWR